MIFIIGGNSQGKLEFARNLLGLDGDDQITDGVSCDLTKAFARPILNQLHVLIKRLIAEGYDPNQFIQLGIDHNPRVTIICDELSTGVIPLLKEDREMQELVGRIQCTIAKRARQVYRVYCSIPVLIKGDEHAL